MQDVKRRVCCFFGHRSVYDKDGSLFESLVGETERLIEKGFNEFIFGGYGDFDSLAYKAVNVLKTKYLYIKTVYVQAYYKSKDESAEIIRKLYDTVIYPDIEGKPKKLAIIYRNQAIIDISDFCIFYVNQSYGGALQAMQYAKRKKKMFMNLAEQIVTED